MDIYRITRERVVDIYDTRSKKKEVLAAYLFKYIFIFNELIFKTDSDEIL